MCLRIELDCSSVGPSQKFLYGCLSCFGCLQCPCERFSAQQPENTNTDGKLALLTRIPTYPNFGTSLFLNVDYGPSRNSPWGGFGLVPTHVRTATWLILPVVICLSQKLHKPNKDYFKIEPKMQNAQVHPSKIYYIM